MQRPRQRLLGDIVDLPVRKQPLHEQVCFAAQDLDAGRRLHRVSLLELATYLGEFSPTMLSEPPVIVPPVETGRAELTWWDDFTADAGTVYALTQPPSSVDRVDVFMTGARLRRVAAAPGPTEYTLTGVGAMTLTLGVAKAAGESLVVSYPYVVLLEQWVYDDFTGVASDTFVLSQTPADPSKVDLFLTGVRLYLYTGGGSPSPIEFALAGVAGTLGLVRSATDTLVARYPKA